MNLDGAPQYGPVTGLSVAGKTTLGKGALRAPSHTLGYRADQIEGGEVRRDLSSDLGFSPADREENVRWIGQFAHMLAGQGLIVVVSVMSHFRQGARQGRRLNSDLHRSLRCM